MVDRTRLTSALAGTEDQLERTLTQRATLARELGDPAAIREEHGGLTSAIDTLARQHTELRNQLADLEVQRRPQWARDALGERPQRTTDAESWDRAARTLARYGIEYDTQQQADPLGPCPTDPQRRDDYERALRARDQLAHQLGRQTPGHELDIDKVNATANASSRYKRRRRCRRCVRQGGSRCCARQLAVRRPPAVKQANP